MKTVDLILYQTAQNQAAYFTIQNGGFLLIKGDDRLDFIQRQTSNDVGILKHDQSVLSVLTSPMARILDVFCLFEVDEALGMITLPGYGEKTTKLLQSKIFFMDKVIVDDMSGSYVQIELFGPKVGEVLSKLGCPEYIEPNRVFRKRISGEDVLLLAFEPTLSLGLRVLIPVESLTAIMSVLEKLEVPNLPAELYDLLRIETGLPAAGSELTDSYTPLEVGLQGAISSTKGCYTGQEVLARQITYDKVTKRLVGLQLESRVTPGEKVWASEKSVGVVTSYATSPRFGDIGLAVLKTVSVQPGTLIKIGDEQKGKRSGIITELPFQIP